jgi:aldose 1-epimerase
MPSESGSGPVSLRRGSLSLELLPEIGGSIGAFCLETPRGPLDLLRRATPLAEQERAPGETACFPLVPYSNRIRDGVFSFRGKMQRIKPNMGTHPHPLHGHGWLAPWKVVALNNSQAELRFDYTPVDFPWAYRATQRFELTHDSLDVHLTLTNMSDSAMPAGFGLHPYFDRTPGVTLKASLPQVWDAPVDCLPEQLIDVPEKWNFARARAIASVTLDDCFTGWDGSCQIEWPERRVRLQMSAERIFSHLVIYVPEGKDFFCVEPVSNMNDGFNWFERESNSGVFLLEPGETARGLVRFRASQI